MSSINAHSDLRRRIAEVDASISGLQHTRWSLQRQLDTVAPSCPILTNISREVTSRIFVHCLDPNLNLAYSTTSPRHAPMLLLHVCRTWRSIALSTPELWANLVLDFDKLPQSFFEGGKLERFIEDCLARSGTCPLSLHIQAMWRRKEEGRRLIPTYLQRLSSRIQALQLRVDIEHYPEHTPGFPLLRSLSLGFLRGDNMARLQENPIQIFSEARNLRELRMYGGAAPSLFVIPQAKLVSFTGEELSSKDFVDFLRLAPSLVECTLYVDPYLNPDTRTITHTQLKFLALAGHNLFQFLTLPGLQTLEVEFAGEVENQHLQAFFSGSAASLKKLSFAYSPPPLSSFSGMTVLADLKLCDPSTEYLAEFFTLLDHTKHPNFLPQLQELELDPCPPYVNTVLVDALSSRSLDGAARLRSFRQLWPSTTPADALQGYYRDEGFGDALEGLVQSGMEIYVGHKNGRKPGIGVWLFN